MKTTFLILIIVFLILPLFYRHWYYYIPIKNAYISVIFIPALGIISGYLSNGCINSLTFFKTQPELALWLSILIGVIVSIIGLLFQNGFLRFFYSAQLKQLLGVQTNSTVAQGFLRELLNYSAGTDTSLFHDLSLNGHYTFRSIITNIENDGAILTNWLYSVLLRVSNAKKPKKHKAIWNTYMVPIVDIEAVKDYCQDLSISYSRNGKNGRKLKTKNRLFVLQPANSASSIYKNNLKYICDEHVKWGFKDSEVRFCYKEDYDRMITHYNSIKDFEDFVIYNGFLWNDIWIIGKKDDSRTKCISVSDTIKEANEFYDELFNNSKEIRQWDN